MDHDQRFKHLIQTFFQEFLQLFFKEWAERLDASAVAWLDKEVFPDPPQGERRILDLVGKLPTRQEVVGQRAGDANHWLALVHIEIESPDKVAPLRPRMFDAYSHLRRQHGLPVLPIGLYLRVGLEGIGIDVYEEHFWELRPVRFEYLYVGLPALQAVEYVQGENWLGVALAALMKIPADQVAWLGAEALRRIKQAPLTDQQRFLLGECVQAYLPLDEAQRREFERLLTTEPYRGVQAMNTTAYEKGLAEGQAMNTTAYEKGLAEGQAMNTTAYEKGLAEGQAMSTTAYEKGLQQGMEKGVEKGQRDLLRELLEEQFGPLAPAVRTRLEQLPPERLQALRKAILKAKSLQELGLEG